MIMHDLNRIVEEYLEDHGLERMEWPARSPDIFDYQGSFPVQEKGGNHLLPGPGCMVDALKLPNQAPRVSGESLQTCVAWRWPDSKPLLLVNH
ncbi:hypothetical protein TNCV_309551 [Trichonephila clavipes]|nr:hypothetical protein TNCV_309551 [Trichonephila clavipes]